MKFSSPDRIVPHGVVPPAQLLSVPRTVVPVGSSTVFSRSEPAAGPVKVNGVSIVMRRFRGAPTTYSQGWPFFERVSSTTPMPCAAIAMRLRSAASSSGGNMIDSLVYSKFATSTPRLPFGSAMMSR